MVLFPKLISHFCMGITAIQLEPEGLSDVKLLSQIGGKMNAPVLVQFWFVGLDVDSLFDPSLKGLDPVCSLSPSRLHDLGTFGILKPSIDLKWEKC